MEFSIRLHPPAKINKMKRYIYLIMLFVSLTGFRDSSRRTITGTVFSNDDKKPLPGVSVAIKGNKLPTSTDVNGRYTINIANENSLLVFSVLGYQNLEIKVGKSNKIDVSLKPLTANLKEVMVVGYGTQRKESLTASVHQFSANHTMQTTLSSKVAGMPIRGKLRSFPNDTESYQSIAENKFTDPKTTPLSTFAVDVDAASYSNVRRFINNGVLPEKDAVRIEEMINYFHYDLAGPVNGAPVAINTELSTAPWNPQHRLLRIGLKAKTVKTDKLPAANFVFLIDVSGSMTDYNKLPLVKSAMKLLVDQLRPVDQVSIVTYAGNAGLRLPGTPGDQKIKIKDAINTLEAGGSTAGGAGIKLAYQIARTNFIKGGNNRIVLATDGDFNVGASSDGDMEQIIENERKSGISLSALGFGMGNLKDSKLETIADKGHGNYAYIDNISEAIKAIVTEFGATMFTVAKDVKLQVEFNPVSVQGYRLIGYENRLLEKEDFNNDQKIGGDMGVGHTVTALYEIIPAGLTDSFTNLVDPLKYQKTINNQLLNPSNEMVTIKFRYKNPDAQKSKMEQVSIKDVPLPISKTSDDFRFASAVAEFGMLLRNSDYKQQSAYSRLIARAQLAKGKDEEGYRAEFINLAKSAKLLSKVSGITESEK